MCSVCSICSVCSVCSGCRVWGGGGAVCVVGAMCAVCVVGAVCVGGAVCVVGAMCAVCVVGAVLCAVYAVCVVCVVGAVCAVGAVCLLDKTNMSVVSYDGQLSVQARVQEFVRGGGQNLKAFFFLFFLLFNFSAEKMIFSTEKVAKYR